MLAEQLECPGGLGEDADGFGSAHLHRVGVALLGEDVGDSVDGGFEPDGITGGGAGDDQFQPMLAVAAEPHEPFLGGCGGLVFGADRVSLDDFGVEQGLQPAPRQRPQGWGELGIHIGGLFGGEVSGGGTNAAGLVGLPPPASPCPRAA